MLKPENTGIRRNLLSNREVFNDFSKKEAAQTASFFVDLIFELFSENSTFVQITFP